MWPAPNTACVGGRDAASHLACLTCASGQGRCSTELPGVWVSNKVPNAAAQLVCTGQNWVFSGVVSGCLTAKSPSFPMCVSAWLVQHRVTNEGPAWSGLLAPSGWGLTGPLGGLTSCLLGHTGNGKPQRELRQRESGRPSLMAIVICHGFVAVFLT